MLPQKPTPVTIRDPVSPKEAYISDGGDLFGISKKKKQRHLKNPLCFNQLHQMCSEHIPNVIDHLTKYGQLSFPTLAEIDFGLKTSFV